jgi:hypothetical protein
MKFVVGDIHGEFPKLEKLIAFILQQDAKAEFIFIGDYLDKGPQSKEVLDFLKKFKEQYSCTFVLGNHEYQWMALHQAEENAAAYLTKYGGKSTQHSFAVESMEELSELMLKEYPFAFSEAHAYVDLPGYFICHSGIPAAKYAHGFHELALKDFLFNRYDFLAHRELYPFYDGYKLGIDTGACYLDAQPLTAFCLETEVFYNSNKEQFSSKEFSLNICPNIIREKSKKW